MIFYEYIFTIFCSIWIWGQWIWKNSIHNLKSLNKENVPFSLSSAVGVGFYGNSETNDGIYQMTYSLYNTNHTLAGINSQVRVCFICCFILPCCLRANNVQYTPHIHTTNTYDTHTHKLKKNTRGTSAQNKNLAFMISNPPGRWQCQRCRAEAWWMCRSDFTYNAQTKQTQMLAKLRNYRMETKHVNTKIET